MPAYARWSIAATVRDLEARLQATGRSASFDPSLVDPPGVWIQPRRVTDYHLAGGGTVNAWLFLIVGNLEFHAALAALDDLLAALDDLDVPTAGGIDGDLDLLATVILPANPTTPLPAYRIAVDLDLMEMTP